MCRLAAERLVETPAVRLLPIHAPHTERIRAHAARGLDAAAAYRAGSPAPPEPVARAVRQAVALWNAGLFFEVHEVLEAVWKTASGGTRQALQGVIQLAVAFHHLAHGNARGARSLLHEGRDRLRAVGSDPLPPLDTSALLAATAAWEDALAGGAVLPADRPILGTRP